MDPAITMFTKLKKYFTSETDCLTEKHLECLGHYLKKLWMEGDRSSLNLDTEQVIRNIDNCMCQVPSLKSSTSMYGIILIYLYFLEEDTKYLEQYLLPLSEPYRKVIFKQISLMFTYMKDDHHEDFYRKTAKLIVLITDYSTKTQIQNFESDEPAMVKQTLEELRYRLNGSKSYVIDFINTFVSVVDEEQQQKNPIIFLKKVMTEFVQLLQTVYAANAYFIISVIINNYVPLLKERTRDDMQTFCLDNIQQVIVDFQKEAKRLDDGLFSKINSSRIKYITAKKQDISHEKFIQCLSYNFLTMQPPAENPSSVFLLGLYYIQFNDFNLLFDAVGANEIKTIDVEYITNILHCQKELKEMRMTTVEIVPEIIGYSLLYSNLTPQDVFVQHCLMKISDTITFTITGDLCRHAVECFVAVLNNYRFYPERNEKLIRAMEGFLTYGLMVTKRAVLKKFTDIKSAKVLHTIYNPVVSLSSTGPPDVKQLAFNLLCHHFERTDSDTERADIVAVMLRSFIDVDFISENGLQKFLVNNFFGDGGYLSSDDAADILCFLSISHIKEFQNGFPLLLNTANATENTEGNMNTVLWLFMFRLARKINNDRANFLSYVEILEVIYQSYPRILSNISDTLLSIVKDELSADEMLFEKVRYKKSVEFLTKIAEKTFYDSNVVLEFEQFIWQHIDEISPYKLTVLIPYLSLVVTQHFRIQNLYLKFRYDLLLRLDQYDEMAESDTHRLLFLLFKLADCFDFENKTFEFPQFIYKIPNPRGELQNLLYLCMARIEGCPLMLLNCVELFCKWNSAVLMNEPSEVRDFYEELLSVEEDCCLDSKRQIIKCLTEFITQECERRRNADISYKENRFNKTVSNYTRLVTRCYCNVNTGLRREVLCFIKKLYNLKILKAYKVFWHLITMVTDVDEIKIDAMNMLNMITGASNSASYYLSPVDARLALANIFRLQYILQNYPKNELLLPIPAGQSRGVLEYVFSSIGSANVGIFLKGVLQHFTSDGLDLPLLKCRLFHIENFARINLNRAYAVRLVINLSEFLIVYKFPIEDYYDAALTEIGDYYAFQEFRYNAIWFLMLNELRTYIMRKYSVNYTMCARYEIGNYKPPAKKRNNYVEFDISSLKTLVIEEMRPTSVEDEEWKLKNKQLRKMLRGVEIK